LGETFYIINNGDLKRKDNNIIITGANGESKNLKVEVTDEIYLFGEVNLNTKVLNFLSQNGIILHVFNYYGYYSGSYYPRETNVSGYLLVNQVKHYDNYEKRLIIAKKILSSSAHNIYRNLRYYNGRGVDLEEIMNQIESLANMIDKSNTIGEIMGIEGNIRKIYYSSWNNIIKQDIEFDKRVKRPPDNMINSLISFINSLVYTTTLSEIYKTQLNPTISYLHQPGTKRFSLSLDISEIFKPIIVDRMIFSILNKNQITENDFDKGIHAVTEALKELEKLSPMDMSADKVKVICESRQERENHKDISYTDHLTEKSRNTLFKYDQLAALQSGKLKKEAV
jgi:CRISPR-associated protein Cas1